MHVHCTNAARQIRKKKLQRTWDFPEQRRREFSALNRKRRKAPLRRSKPVGIFGVPTSLERSALQVATGSGEFPVERLRRGLYRAGERRCENAAARRPVADYINSLIVRLRCRALAIAALASATLPCFLRTKARAAKTWSRFGAPCSMDVSRASASSYLPVAP
jgi:hypothetical protein